jgi:hypothetical protein
MITDGTLDLIIATVIFAIAMWICLRLIFGGPASGYRGSSPPKYDRTPCPDEMPTLRGQVESAYFRARCIDQTGIPVDNWPGKGKQS